ncbi:Uncharacterised protein [Klebsiella pneumoniae]|nr:Uncharacterised protein [Klebsiella pneumoniae]SWR89385.1 Uncharacterised protein [Klebsiella pneumoniae]SWY38012.1 Uncharacterised protein [Klebsiella pneumoniae]SXM28535.1 Uncharacterised protein [Klebsiella pneumoniae]SXN42140.1 Uncharacterised protein [Klebsiella pneumoniae]
MQLLTRHFLFAGLEGVQIFPVNQSRLTTKSVFLNYCALLGAFLAYQMRGGETPPRFKITYRSRMQDESLDLYFEKLSVKMRPFLLDLSTSSSQSRSAHRIAPSSRYLLRASGSCLHSPQTPLFNTSLFIWSCHSRSSSSEASPSNLLRDSPSFGRALATRAALSSLSSTPMGYFSGSQINGLNGLSAV